VTEPVAVAPFADAELAVRERVWPTVAAVCAYVAAIAGTEWVAAFGSPVAAAALAGVLLVALLAHYVWSGEPALAALALVPLLRIASLALVTGNVVSSCVLAGVPVLIGVVLAARALDLQGVIALWQIRLRSQWHVALGTLVLARAAPALLTLAPVVSDRSPAEVLVAAAVVFVFAGVLEELLFRGVVQAALAGVVRGWSVPLADVLFAATYVGSGSWAYTVFMAAFGLACGWWVRRTGSVAGAAVAHGLLAAGVLVVWS
jgi:membrane protease YdiL (CAAX protease family)